MSPAPGVKPQEVELVPRVVDTKEIAERGREIFESIAHRAYEIFENSGYVLGSDLEDWFAAESELLHPTHVNVSETGSSFTVRLDVPGFKAEEIRVTLEPNQLTILGERKFEEKGKTEKLIYSETCSDQIYRVIGLPAEVVTRNAKTTLKNGVLEIELQKATPAGPARTGLKSV